MHAGFVAYVRLGLSCSFFFNDTATTEIYTLSLHDALPISWRRGAPRSRDPPRSQPGSPCSRRSEEHTSELQSHVKLVCRLLLEKNNQENVDPVDDNQPDRKRLETDAQFTF